MNIYLGKNLKKLRVQKNLTQEKLAEFLGVSFQTISKWERGESYPDITMLPVIASLFGVTTDELLGLNTAARKEKTDWYKREYSRLWSERKQEEVKALMLEATKEFPSDYDLLSKYFNALIQCKHEDKYKLEIKGEVKKIYEKTRKFAKFLCSFI